MRNTLHTGILLLFLWLGGSASAQDAAARLDSTEIYIGDQISFYLEFTAPDSVEAQWPYRQDTLTDKIEILRQSEVDSMPSGEGRYKLKQELRITSFDTGYLAIPPVSFSYQDNGEEKTTKTEPLLLRVKPVEVDTAQPIRAIKGPMSAPLTLAEVLPWLLGAVALILLALLIWYVVKRRKAHKPVIPVKTKPRQPAHTEALNALDRLKEKKLWQQGHVKAYYSELSYIIRYYIERRYEIPAVESVSGDILDDLNDAGLSKALSEKLSGLFELSDLAKFAKLEPLPAENEKALQDAFSFVKETAPREEPQKEKGGQYVE